MDLGITQIGLTDADERRLKAILGMAVSTGGLQHRWHLDTSDTARLFVVAADSAEGLALVAANGEDSGKFFAVLAGESDDIPPNCLRLPWPLRIENVLSILKYVESRTEDFEDEGVSTLVLQSTASENHVLRLASMLRDMGGTSAAAIWEIKGLSRRSLYVAPGQRAFYFPDSLESLRSVDLSVRLEFLPIPTENLPDHLAQKPIVMLQWLIGLLTGRLGLFPWISTDSALRLRRFPEFQMLHHTAQHRRIAAELTRPRLGVDVIAESTGIDSRVVTEFINASNLCGYLAATNAKPIPRSPAPKAAASRRALFQSFRRALGMVNADA